MNKIPRINKDEMKIPPKWILKEYLSLDLPMKFNSSDIENRFKDKNNKNQFLNQANKFNLVIRLKRGSYFAPEPSIASMTWSLDNYYSRLILLNFAFKHMNLDHSFYCISASTYSDYSPDRVIPVLKSDCKDIDQKYVDHFIYDHSKGNEKKIAVYNSIFNIPLLSKKDTAILLLSTYMAREMEAGRKILEEISIDDKTRALLGGLGYDEYSEGMYEKSDIERPMFIKKWMNEVGIEKVKERANI